MAMRIEVRMFINITYPGGMFDPRQHGFGYFPFFLFNLRQDDEFPSQKVVVLLLSLNPFGIWMLSIYRNIMGAGDYYSKKKDCEENGKICE